MPYFNKSQKDAQIVQLLEEAITILASVGIPVLDKTERSLERMAMSFLAVAGVTKHWNEASDKRFLKTREVINFINQHFSENISSGCLLVKTPTGFLHLFVALFVFRSHHPFYIQIRMKSNILHSPNCRTTVN